MTDYRLDTRRIRHGFDRAAAHYDQVAIVQQQVCEQLLERLDYVAISPRVVVDAGTGTGRALGALQRRYPDAQLLALDSSRSMMGISAEQAGAAQRVCGDIRAAPLRASRAGLVFSNLLLPWCDDLDAVLAQFHRLLAASGLLTFTTLGPDTLQELRRAWYQVDRDEHVHGFIDMHDIGDALLRNGFADPVLDVERYTLTYPGLDRLLRELRHNGSVNALPGRARGLLGRRRFAAVEAAYRRDSEDSRLSVTVEVVYGHAWRPEQQRMVDPGLVRIPASRIGRRSS